MENRSNYILSNYYSKYRKPENAIFCIKFYPFSEEHVFAVAVQNKVILFEISDDNGKNFELVQEFKTGTSEYIYSLDWSFAEDTSKCLVAGGATGKLHNVFTSSIFGTGRTNKHDQNAINEIKFSPSVHYLCGVAYQDGLISLYNVITEVCVANFETMRRDICKQIVSLSFDPSGNYLAFSGMTKEIFIASLKDNTKFQETLAESIVEQDIQPENFNFLNNMVVVKSLHEHYIDCIHWYGEFSFISKSCSGDISFWCIEKTDPEAPTFSSDEPLKVIKIRTLNIENCDFWFMKFTIDSYLNYLSIGTCTGEVCLWNLEGDSFEDWKCQKLTNPYTDVPIRHSTFSNDGKFLVCCTDNGVILTYKKYDDILDDIIEAPKAKKIKKKSSKSKKFY